MRWMLFALCLLAANLGAQSGSWNQATSSAPWSDRWGHTAVSFNGSLWVLGGTGAANYNDVWSSSDGTTWTQATASAPWSARWYHTSVVFNNRIWVMGGYSTTYLNDVWSSADGINWTLETAAAPWSARRGHASVVFNGRLWVMGGAPAPVGPNTYLDDVWSSADGVNWTLETNAPWDTYRASSVVFNNRIWLMSGLGTANIWSSANGITWVQELSYTPWSYWLRGSVNIFDNQLWYVGGDDGSWATNEVWTSSNGTTWTQRASAPWTARSDHAATTFNSGVFVLGGYNGGTLRDVWSYRYNDDSFEPNDTFGAAAGVSTGTSINLRCYNPDWYRINVATGQTLTVTINFNHNDGDLDMELYDAGSTYVTGSGSTTNQEQVSTTASTGQEFRWAVYGYNGAANYQYSMTVSLSGGTGGILSWTPSSYDFGTITLGTDASRQFQLSCTGATVTGTISVTGSAYTIVSGGGAFSLSNGQTRNVTVRFTPSSVNTFFGTLSATGGGSPGASLVGDGVASGGGGDGGSGGGGDDKSCSTGEGSCSPWHLLPCLLAAVVLSFRQLRQRRGDI